VAGSLAIMIVMRHAEDDFRAYQTAEGMENAGVEVFSVTACPANTFRPYIVWGKIGAKCQIDLMDAEIEKLIDGQE